MQVQTDTGVTTFTIDPSHSRVGFTVRHMGFSKVRGSFGDFEGHIEMAPGQLESLQTEAVIKTASVDTRAAQRDEHLRSGDFFDVEKFPELTFRSTEVRNVQGDNFTLVGELGIRGVSREVELDATFLGEGTDPWGGKRTGFEARGSVNRKDFGLLWNQVLETGGMLVSDTVEIELEIQATERPDEN